MAGKGENDVSSIFFLLEFQEPLSSVINPFPNDKS